MKKRLFAALFAALLLVTLLVPGVSAAAGKVSLSASGAPQAGKTVTLTVKLSDATNVSGIAVTPTFDKGQFTLTDGKWVAEGGLISDFSVENGDGVIAFAAPTKVSGQILTFTLKVNAKTAAGKYTVGCSVVVSDDSGNHTLTAQTAVTVSCTHSFTAKNTAAKYQKSAASCTSGAVYYYSCAHCGEKGDKTFVSGEKTAHTFDRKKETAAFVHTKGSCTERGVYYYSCVCGEKGTETFVGAAPAHKVDEGWKTDEASHWHLCTACGEVSDKAAHTPSAPATETTPQTCTVCGYVLAPALKHEHDFTAKPHQDEAHHWGECACGEVSDKVAHNWGDGKIFAADDEKLTLFTCPDCGAEKYEKAALGDNAPDDTPNNTPDAPADNDADTATESGSFGGGLAVGGIVGLLIGAAVMLVVKKKNKPSQKRKRGSVFVKAKRIISLLLVLFTLLQMSASGVSAATVADEHTHLHTHAEVLVGDMDDSGKVDVADAVYLLRAVLLPNSYPLHQSGDMDGDKDTDVADAIYLLRHTLLPDKYPLNVHTHTPKTVVGKAATCTEAGVTDSVVCDTCGVTLSGGEPIAAKGHVAVVTERVSATCTADGHVIKHCAACKTDFVAETTYAKGHSYGEPQELAAPTCTKAGLKLITCTVCQGTKETVIPALGHTFVVVSTAGDVITYACEICGETTTDITAADPVTEEHIYDCTPDYSFEIKSDLDEDAVRDRVQIIDAFFADTAYEDHADAAHPFLLESRGNGVWLVKPDGAWEKGVTYRVRVGEGVALADHTANTFFFTVKDDNHAEMTLQEDIIFIVLPAVGTSDRDNYILLTETENDRIYLTMPNDGRVTAADVGKVVCAGAYRSLEEILQDSTKECCFGKIEEVYLIADGRITLVLSCPELDEIFSELDAFEEQQLTFTEEEIPADLREDAVQSLLVSEDFNEFLASVTVAAEAYAAEKGVTAQGVANLDFLKDLDIKTRLNIKNNDTLVVTLEGKLPIKLKDGAGKNIGTVTVSFSVVCEFTFKVGAAAEIKRFWGVPTGLKEFDFAVTQTSKYTFNFSVSVGLKEIHNDPSNERRIVKTQKGVHHFDNCMLVANTDKSKLTNCSAASLDAEFRKNGGVLENECKLCRPFMSYLRKKMYVVNNETHGVHRFLCDQPDRVTAATTTVTMQAPIGAPYELCDYCFGGAADEEELSEEDNFIEKMGEALAYTNWSDLVQSVRDKVCGKQPQASKQKAISLLHKPIPVAYIFSVNIDVDMIIEIKFTGSFSLKHEVTNTTVTGLRKTADGALKPTFSRSESKAVSTLQVIGSFDVKAGVRLRASLSIVGLGKFVYVGFSAQIGGYSELDGVLHASKTTITDEDGKDVERVFFAAAYWEMGIYIDISFDYRLFVWGDSFSLLGGEKRFPLIALGYDKVYYGYGAPTDLVEATDTKAVDLAALNMLRVNCFNTKNQKNSSETLDMNGQEGLYTVTVRVLDKDGNVSPFATVQNGVLTVADNAPCDLTVTVEITVTGVRKPMATIVDFLKENYSGTPLYKLPLYTFDVRVQNHTASDWVETKAPTCTEEGEESRHATCDCVWDETRPVDPLGHDKKSLEAVKVTCTTSGLTAGEYCARCQAVFVAQEVIPARGHQYTDPFTCHDRACLYDDCDHVELATTDHRLSDWFDVPPGGCNTVGYQIRFCLDCGHGENSLTDGDVVLHAHDPSPIERQNPTCEEDGFLRSVCLRCELVLVDEPLLALGHDWQDTFDDEGHFKTCARFGCGAATEKEAHRFDNLCDPTCNGCDYVRETAHAWQTDYTVTETTHYYACDNCPARKDEAAHGYTNACDTDCNACGHTRSITHTYNEQKAFDTNGHWQVCDVCGATTAPIAHRFDNACDPTCNGCDYVRETDHAWQKDYTVTETGHYIACDNCPARKDEAAHGYDDACDTDCNVCGHIRTVTHTYNAEKAFDANGHWQVCDVCGATTTPAAHRFDNACDPTCDACDYVRDVDHAWQTTYTAGEATHYYACDNCTARKDEAPHAYDDACDTDCNVCGHTRTVAHDFGNGYLTDGTHHWYECAVCHEVSDKAPHSGGKATCEAAAVCETCGESYGDPLGHDWSDYTRWETEHMRRCNRGCGKWEGGLHRFTDFVETEATCTEDGYKTRTCTVCDYEHVQKTDAALGHAWDTAYTTDADAHWYACARCDATDGKGDHVYKNDCTTCDVCDYVRRADHLWGATYQTDENGHWKACTACDAVTAATPHAYDNACDTDCNVCGRTRPITHAFGDSYVTDSTHHWQVCGICGATSDKEAHNGEATCEAAAVCSVCGVTHAAPLGHAWDTAYTTDTAGHWYACARCDEKKDAAAHDFGDSYTQNASQHWQTCTTCGYETTHTTHDWSEIYAFDGTHHWRRCATCGFDRDKMEHRGGTATCTTAATCTVCHNTYGEALGHDWATAYTTDDNGHWYACSRCSEKKDYGAHGGGEATCTLPATCLICGEGYGDTIPHSYVMQKATAAYAVKAATCTSSGTYRFSCICGKAGTATFTVTALGHDWATAYSHDDSNHWYACTRAGCTATNGKATHIGGTATCKSPKVCTECGNAYGSSGPHNYNVKNNQYKAADATCLNPAKYYYACAYCGGKGSTTYYSGEALGHNYSTTYVSDATGHARKCTRCSSTTDNGAHVYDKTETIIAATCTKVGRDKLICSTCNYARYVQTSALGHDLSTDLQIVTEKTVSGAVTTYTHHVAYCCERDGCDYYEPKHSSTAHEHAGYKPLVGTPATCTEAGLSDGIACATCNEVFFPQETIPALGHNFVNGVCDRCGWVDDLATADLLYQLSADSTYYIVTGLKSTCTDTDIFIPKMYNGKPVKEIRANAFAGCTFTSVQIGENITTIGNNAFNSCVNLTDIRFNAIAVTDLPSNNGAFLRAGTAGEGVTVTFGEKVTKVPAYLFCGDYGYDHQASPKITKIVFAQNGVCTTIGNNAFRYLRQLTDIQWASSVTHIGSYSFGGCETLKELTLVNGLISIGNSAFSSCYGLESISLPPSLMDLENSAFQNAYSLKNIYFNAANMNDLARSNDAFRMDDITKASEITVTIGKNVERTPSFLFDAMYYDCTPLVTKVIFESDSVCTEIGDNSFNGCRFLTELQLPNSVKTIGICALAGCEALEYLDVPDSVTVIGDDAFSASGLKTIKLPANLTRVEWGTFDYCENLESIDIPDSVTEIGDYAFADCYALKTVTLSKSLTTIGAQAFRECESLTSITIPEGVTAIGDYAFSGCASLAAVTFNAVNIPDAEYHTEVFTDAGSAVGGFALTIGKKVTRIPYGYFEFCDTLKSVTFTTGGVCKTIAAYAFYYCENLTTVTLITGIKEIGEYAFGDCPSLTSIVIPGTVTTLSQYVFYGCTSLTKAVLNEGLVTIGNNAFEGCTSLASITIPASVKYIEDCAFYDCSKLKKITFKGNAPTFNNDIGIFYGVTATAYYYNTASNWTSAKKQNYGGKLTWTQMVVMN